MSSFSYYSPLNSMWSSAFNPSSSTSTATAKTFYPPAVSPGTTQTREGEVEERLMANSTPSYSSENNLKTSSPTTAYPSETNIKTEYTESSGELYPAAPTSLRKDGEGVCSSSGYPSLEKGPAYPIDKGSGYLLEKGPVAEYPALEKGYPGYPPAPPLPSPLYTGGYTTGPSLPTDYARPKPKSKAASAGKVFVCMFAWNY